MATQQASPERPETFTEHPPQVVIEGVSPQIDCGRHPVKRVQGDELSIEADAYAAGHDQLAARALVWAPSSPGSAPRYVPMAYDYNEDRFRASLKLDLIGRWRFSVEAWVGAFATWRDHVERKLEFGQDVSSELLEGAELVSEAAGRASGSAATTLQDSAEVLRDTSVDQKERGKVALSTQLRELMARHFDPATITRYDRDLEVIVDRPQAGFAAWYEMFPRSQGEEPGVHGTFRDAERRLPRLAELGFDVIYLPPIHPIGITNRKGKNNSLTAEPGDPGSPWAIGNEHGGHDAIEPKLGTLQDFRRLLRKADELGMEIALDYALQCSPDHPWVKEHPDWFFRRPDGTIHYAENPPKKYEDIYPLNFWCEDREGLWRACRDVLLYWIDVGVKTFRVDNPHTKPFVFWEWMLREIQDEHPDVVFLSEAFTRPKRMKGLAKLGFTQSYTYFTWRNHSWELREYLEELSRKEMVEYFRPNFFANTPDILHEYLQKGGRPAFRIRLLLAATLSPIYGIYSGFELCENEPREPGSEEYLNSEKYEIRVRDWEAPGNINADIKVINRIRKENPALQRLDNITFHPSENDQVLFYHKQAPGNDLLIVVNLDPHGPQDSTVHAPLGPLGVGPDERLELEDTLTGERYTWHGVKNVVRLDPEERVGHVLRVVR